MLEPHWTFFYLISFVPAFSGYYLGLQGQGYRPFRTPTFYSTAFVVIVPYIGITVMARRLFFTQQPGTAPCPKKRQVSLWSTAFFAAIIIALASLSLPVFLADHRQTAIAHHILLARENLALARQVQGNGTSLAAPLTAAQKELDAAKRMAERYDLSGRMGGRISCISGELHLLRREWNEAERDYRISLSTTALDRDDVELLAREGLAEVNVARKKDLR